MTPAAAAAAMRAAGLRAPLPCDTPEGIAAAGQCFEFETEDGRCVFVARIKGDVLWIDGAAGQGAGMTEPGMRLAEEAARRNGCRHVAFETGRRGLVRKTKKLGYSVAGYVLTKALQ